MAVKLHHRVWGQAPKACLLVVVLLSNRKGLRLLRLLRLLEGLKGLLLLWLLKVLGSHLLLLLLCMWLLLLCMWLCDHLRSWGRWLGCGKRGDEVGNVVDNLRTRGPSDNSKGVGEIDFHRTCKCTVHWHIPRASVCPSRYDQLFDSACACRTGWSL